MITVLFFDTETNGLPKERNALTTSTENWPHILQISWTTASVSTDSLEILEQQTHFLKLEDDIVFNTESAAIHKIEENIVRTGTPSREILEKFQKAAKSVDVIVAHNLSFDKSVLWASYYRLNDKETFSWWPQYEYCTMNATKGLLKLPSKFAKPKDPWKLPRLSELHIWLFQKEPEKLHTADADVDTLISCFKELCIRKVVSIELWEHKLKKLD